MKKKKKIIQLSAIVIMLAAVIVLATIPAGATVNLTDSAKGHGTQIGLQWDSYLTINETEGTARLYIERNSTGAVAPLLSGVFEGEYYSGYRFSAITSDGVHDTSDKSLNIKKTFGFSTGYVISGAYCNFWVTDTDITNTDKAVSKLVLPEPINS